MKLITWNAVVAAQSLNPTVFSQLWLARNGIVEEGEFLPGSIFSDALAQANTREFQMLVLPTALQFAPQIPAEKAGKLVVEKVGAVVRLLPHTPYTAVGLNFVWHEKPSGESLGELSRRLFAVPSNPLYGEFESPDAQFGSYLSKNYRGARLRLDIKPITENQTREGRLQFSFNLHKDLSRGNAVDEILETLNLWDDGRNYSESLVSETLKELAR